MKYSFEARAEARENRQNIIDVKVSRAIEVIEARIDHAVDKGYLGCSVDLGKFLEDFDTEIKEEITKYLSMYGYKIKWIDRDTIDVIFEGD